VPGVRQWMGDLLLRAPAPLRSARKFPILGNAVHVLSHWILPTEEKVWAQVQKGPLQGIWLQLNPRTGQGYYRGETEPAAQEVILQNLHPGDVFYDLGANIGLFSLLGAKIVENAGRVYSFEPDAEVAARLRRNVARNGFSNVTIVEAGVWSSSGSLNFSPADASSVDRGTGSFVRANPTVPAGAVRCVALDDFIGAAPPPNGIKCDVEFAEWEVLRGAKHLLETRRPWILCELHSEENSRAIRAFLGELRYEIQDVDRSHIFAFAASRG